MNKKILAFSYKAFLVILCLFYSIIFSSQVLGILKFYRLIPAITLTIVVFTALIKLLCIRELLPYLKEITSHSEKDGGKFQDYVFYGSGIILIIIIAFPLITWPFSPINDTLTWDAGLYHFPKAIELFRTGSAWDLSIDYGDYPFGYESLISFGYLLTNSGFLIGAVHFLIAILLFLSIWLISIRLTNISPSLLFFLTSLLLTSGFLNIDSNLWWIIKYLIFTIGKNDLFLGTLILTFTLFSPIGSINNHSKFNIYGMSITSMLALSAKPNSIFYLLPIWVYTAFMLFTKAQLKKKSKYIIRIVAAILIMIPGIFWVFRNYISLNGNIFINSSNLLSLSIINNVRNPKFYEYIPQHFKIIFYLLIFAFLLIFIKKEYSTTLPLTYLVYFLGFIATPASAFSSISQERTEIAWRFSVALLIFVYLFLLSIFEPLINKALHFINQRKITRYFVPLIPISCSLFILFSNLGLFSLNKYNDVVLRDQFRESVGNNGYFSAYDFVQQNIHDSIIWVENGLPFYLYDREYSNSPTRSKPADFYVVFQTDWHQTSIREYPKLIFTDEFKNNWLLIYEDSEGRVYQRR